MNWRYVMGSVTIVLIVGGTIYAIKKSLEKTESDEGEISLEEARAMIEAHKLQPGYKPLETSMDKTLKMAKRNIERGIVTRADYDEELLEIVDECRDEASYNRSFMPQDDESDEEEEEYVEEAEYQDTPDPDIPFINIMTEEDKKLRYDPNSIDAIKQYMRMELAEWSPADKTYQTLSILFDFRFEPTNDGDNDLKNNISDYRASFFGPNSKWNGIITFADVILHYARLTNFNCDESVRYWVEYFLEYNELHYSMSNDDIHDVINTLNNHIYFNEDTETFGLFGLTNRSMNDAINIANRNIDKSVTYEIEFNEFLKSII